MTDLCSSLEHFVWFATILNSLKTKCFLEIKIFCHKPIPKQYRVYLYVKKKFRKISFLLLKNNSMYLLNVLCECVCVYIYIPSLSSCHAISMDIPDPLSPCLPIVHCSWQVLRGHIPYRHRAAVCRFDLDVLLLFRPWEGVHRSASLMSS